MDTPFYQFAQRHQISNRDCEALYQLDVREKSFDRGAAITHPGDWPAHCMIVLDGYIGRSKMTASGQQQIINVYLTGDTPDLNALFLPPSDSDLFSIGPSRVGFIRRDDLIDLLANYPGLVAAVSRDVAIDLSITREWLLNVGQRNAEERLAHFFLEMLDRSRSAQTSNGALRIPLTQNHIAAIIGVSSIHVNRVLQQLRGLGYVTFSRKFLEIQQEEALAQLAGYDQAYLHLRARNSTTSTSDTW